VLPCLQAKPNVCNHFAAQVEIQAWTLTLLTPKNRQNTSDTVCQATICKSPAVQQCWYTTGPTDFILVVRVASMAAYEQFTREVLMSQDNVVKFTSYVVLDEVKTGLALAV
jgi:DNA-binding Lrp family transcriptional regulator